MRTTKPFIVRRCIAISVVLLVVLSALPASAATVTGNTAHWTNNFRRWPWKGGKAYYLNQIDGHSYASTSARKAIDVGLPCGTPVYAISSGFVVKAGTGSGTGKYVQAKHDEDNNGTYEIVTYEHLSSSEVDAVSGGKPTALLQGDLIGYSGDTGRSTGCHLHFQRSSTVSFDSSALELAPINGVYKTQLNTEDSYISANVGVGRHSGGTVRQPIRARYAGSGNYWSIGIPGNITQLWSPCRALLTNGTPWTYSCNPPGTSFSGGVQTYLRVGVQKAIMQKTGVATAYVVWRGALGVYTELDENGHDYVYTIGYPTGQRYATGGRYRQDFEAGWIMYDPTDCAVEVWKSNPTTMLRRAYFCD